jgi:hypothetical protein
MTWQEVAAIFAQKDVVWFLGPTILVLAGVILIWVYRSKRNGNGHANVLADKLQTDSRIDMMAKDIAVIKESLNGLNHWVDQSRTTALRQASEWGEFKAKLAEMDRRLNQTPPTGN